MNTQDMEQNVDIAEYWHTVVKHKWLILFCLAVITGATVFFTLQMKPVYQATSTMVIENSYSVSPVTGEKIDYGGYINQQMVFNTHLKMIKSRPVLERVIQRLGIQPEKIGENAGGNWIAELVSRIKKNLSLLRGKAEEAETPMDPETGLVDSLSRKITVAEVRDTHLLKISAEDNDPARARDLADNLAEAYIEFDASGRLGSSKEMLKWMTAQLYEVKKKLEDAEAEFQAYKRDEKLFSIEGRQNVITQKISDFNDAYLENHHKRLELDSKLAELKRITRKKGSLMNVRLLVDSEVISTLYSNLIEAEVEYNRLSKVYKEKHPKTEQVLSLITKTRNKLNEEIQKEIENLKSQRSVLASKEEILQKTIADFENDALETNKKALQYTILERNVETSRKLYDTLLTKIEATNVDEDMDMSNIRLIERADLPEAPVKPNKARNILLGMVMGLFAGIGMAFLREYMDQSFRNEEDVRKYLGLPVLSVIPEAEKN